MLLLVYETLLLQQELFAISYRGIPLIVSKSRTHAYSTASLCSLSVVRTK
jgi:hypothetical protein